MKAHTTNYFDTFIEVSEDTKATSGKIPNSKNNNKTVAEHQFDLIAKNPYKFTSDDVFFQVYADRNDLTQAEYEQARAQFFSKGQPCFRASPLTKTHGFGIHSDNEGRVALYAIDSEEYANFLKDTKVKKLKAMRSSRK